MQPIFSPKPGLCPDVRVSVDGDGLRLGEECYPVLSGEVHYWRLDPVDWPTVLDAVVELGFATLSTYVPWSRHETERGSFDFKTGALEVERFFGLAVARGLKVIVRPGPNGGAELEDSGWPRRVLDNPACQARRPDGRPYLLPTSVHQAFMPSYGSRATLREVARWYDEVIPRLARNQWPGGPIVASHIDNECGYHFQAHAFAMDYHPDTLAQWENFIAERYGDPADLGEAYGGAYSNFSVAPPRDGRDGPEQRRLDWVAFREEHLRNALAELAQMQRERGLDRVAFIHNDYPRKSTPLDTGALERSGAVDIAAGDIYATRRGGRYVRDYARYLSGSTRLPYLAEMGVGWLTLPWLLPMAVDDCDVEHTVFQAIAGGIRAANVFMLVERDRWYGSPISRRGEVRDPQGTFFRRLNGLIRELDWHRLRRHPQVLLLHNRLEERRSAARAVRGDLVPGFAQMLPLDRRLFSGVDPDGFAIETWRGEVTATLEAAGLDWDEAGTSAPPDLTSYQLVVLPVAEMADPVLLEAGSKAAKSGVTAVLGPGRPILDAHLHPIAEPPKGWTALPEPKALAGLLPVPEWSTEHPEVAVTSFSDDHREVLLVVNNAATDLCTKLHGVGRFTLTGRWRTECLSGTGFVPVALPAWGVQVFEITRA